MLLRVSDRVVGFRDKGQGIPLLLMHAFPLNRSMFEPQNRGVSDSLRLITFDSPGAGDSEAGPIAMEEIADLAVAVLDSLGIEKAVVGGVSMGGYAAFAMERRYPNRLLGLVLANTKPAGDSEKAKADRRELAAVAREQGAAAIADRMLPKLLGETTHRERSALVERVRAMIESTAPETIASWLDALARRADSTDRLAKISVPTLVIAGEEDSLAPVRETAEWARRIPGSRFLALPAAGHLPNLETPRAFNAQLKYFLASDCRARRPRVVRSGRSEAVTAGQQL